MLHHPPLVTYKIFPIAHLSAHRVCTFGTASTPTSSKVTPSTPPTFEFEFHSEPSVFPELRLPGHPCVLIGIDPDANGAIATLQWSNTAALRGASAEVIIAAAQARVFDMPTEVWNMKTREKKRPCPVAFLDIIRNEIDLDPCATFRAAVEFTTPGLLSGKYAWYDSGFATGMITGLFVSRGVSFLRVSAHAWKNSLGLRKTGKEGSLALARQIFPQAADVYLKRKKDHGRAEALLIAAWALGLRATNISVPPIVVDVVEDSASLSPSSTEDEGEMDVDGVDDATDECLSS